MRFDIVTHKHFNNFLIPSIHTASHDRSTGNIFLTCTRLRMCAAGIRVLIMIWHVFPDLYLLNTILNVFKQPASIDWISSKCELFPEVRRKRSKAKNGKSVLQYFFYKHGSCEFDRLMCLQNISQASWYFGFACSVPHLEYFVEFLDQ